ncbi:MAG: thioredoxin family protein [Planctomycetota bacterium]|nr:thioredoxin family protein [Planctomycetota bacterium]
MLSRRVSLPLTAVLCLLLSSAVLSPGDAQADDEIHARWRDFAPSGTYVLVQNRKPNREAEILHSRRAAAFLILNSGYEGVLLLEPRTSSVSEVDPASVKRRADGRADLVANAKVKSLGRFRRSRRDIQIRLTGYTADLQPNPPLLGWASYEEVARHSPEYLVDAKTFPLDERSMKALERFKGKARIQVYYGSWCPTCTRYLGRIMRLEKALKEMGKDVGVYYYGLPRTPAMYRDAEVRRQRIRKLPSGVIYRDGRRVGLVASTRWSKPAVELARLLVGGS